MNARLSAAALLLLTACGPSVEVPATTHSALTVTNGRELNGRELNGRELNGRELNGRELNGRELNGRELNGRELNGRELNGRELNGRELNGRTAGGVEFQGDVVLDGSELVVLSRGEVLARGAGVVGMTLSPPDGFTYRLDSAAAVGDVWSYEVSVWLQGWEPLCEAGAIPLSGYWNSAQGVPTGGAHFDDPAYVTFACRDAALGKCVDAGYAPWRGARAAEQHQACTRALRADYCGDGRSLTHDGEWINLYDGDGIQVDTEAWSFEAEWDAAGARCVSALRRSPAAYVPRCGKALLAADCGALEHFATGTLLMTEFSRSP